MTNMLASMNLSTQFCMQGSSDRSSLLEEIVEVTHLYLWSMKRLPAMPMRRIFLRSITMVQRVTHLRKHASVREWTAESQPWP